MARKVSHRIYKTEAAFRREVERRLGGRVPDRIWLEIGGSVWRDQEIERGYAVKEALDFALIALRYRRRSEDLLFPPQQRTKDPRDLQLWQLRSRFLALQAAERANNWRRRFLPYSLGADSFTLKGESGAMVTRSREGALGPDEFKEWLELLVKSREGYFFAKSLSFGGPDFRVAPDVTLTLHFPSGIPPSFLDENRVPANWWSASDANSEGQLTILGTPAEGGGFTLQPNHWGERTLRGLADEAIWMGSGNWGLAETVGFILFDATPLLRPLRARVADRFDDTGWGSRVTLSVDHRVSADEVEAFYRDIGRDRELRLWSAPRAKGFSSRVGTLLEFAFARWPNDGKPRWHDLWQEWQQSYGRRGWSYASPAVLARVVNRAMATLERELAPWG